MKAAQLLDDFGREVTEAGLFAEPFFALAPTALPAAPIFSLPSGADDSELRSADSVRQCGFFGCNHEDERCGCRLRSSVESEAARVIVALGGGDFTSRHIHLPPVSLSAPGGMRALHRTECKNFTHCIDADAHAGEHRVWSDTIVQGWLVLLMRPLWLRLLPE